MSILDKQKKSEEWQALIRELTDETIQEITDRIIADKGLDSEPDFVKRTETPPYGIVEAIDKTRSSDCLVTFLPKRVINIKVKPVMEMGLRSLKLLKQERQCLFAKGYDWCYNVIYTHDWNTKDDYQIKKDGTLIIRPSAIPRSMTLDSLL